MKRMDKSMRQEFTWRLPTPKRLKIIKKSVIARAINICHANNECYKLIEIERHSTNGLNAINIIMIRDNISSIDRYINLIRKMNEELEESLKELYNLVECNPDQYRYPLFLKMRLKKVLHVSELTMNIHNEMADLRNKLRSDFIKLLEEIEARN